LLTALTVSAFAHREPGILTTIEWNNSIERTEIIHRIHTHDAELGVAMVDNLPLLSVGNTEGMARIALYVENHFSILSEEGSLDIELVGAELIGDYIFVYQEWIDPLSTNIFIKNEILREIYPLQINQVNIISEGNIRTLTFTEKEIVLPYLE
jgi:hypothetical protein|tara:strand:- start:23778 stop:24236 length:459 start_codon:yes stop_codon:yes gene_type:complete